MSYFRRCLWGDDQLPHQEQKIVALIAQGLTNKEIAQENHRQGISFCFLGLVGIAEAPQVGDNGTEADAGERRNLVPPEMRRIKETMEEEHSWAITFVHNVGAHPPT